jgi:hypothetical protein
MNSDTITGLIYFYILVATGISIFVAFRLEKCLKTRLPATRPYRWGFYVGSMGMACAPIAVLGVLGMVLVGMNSNWEAFGEVLAWTVFFAVHAVSGWFVIQRKRWAWVVTTIFSFNIFTWIINYIYGRNRWSEFVSEPCGSAGSLTASEGV